MSLRLTKAQRATLREKFGGACAYCGHPLGERWHADHFEAVQRHMTMKGGRLVSGGMDKPANDRIDNLMPACAPCNISKATFDVEEWRGWLARHVAALNAHHSTYRLVKAFGLVVETGNPVTFHFERLAQQA